MPEFHSDSLVPPKYGVTSPFAKLAWSAIILVVLGVGALFATKFDFSRLRGADHFIGKARQAIMAEDWEAAVGAIRHVQGSDRERAEFLRVLADFLEATHSEPALLDSTLMKLDTQGLMLPVDFIWACRLQVAAGKTVAARKALERIPAGSRETAEVMKLSIGILKEEGRKREAAEVERRLIERFPDDPEIVLLKAIIDLQGAFSELQSAALQRLWNLAKEPTEYGLKAIYVLSQQGSLTLAEATRLLDLTDKTRLVVPPAERLRIVSMIMRLDPDRRELLLDAQVDRYHQAGLPALRQLASWLAQEKEYDRLMALAPADSMGPKNYLLQSPELFPLVALGLAKQARWTDLLTLLNKDKHLPVSKAKAASWRALATKNLDVEAFKEARGHLEEAIREGNAEKDGAAIFESARLAEEWGMSDLALKAYEMLAVPGSPREAGMLEKCWQMASHLKDSSKLLRLSEQLCRLKPESTPLARQRDYLRLLVGQNIETTSVLQGEGRITNRSAQLLEVLKAYRLHDIPQMLTALRSIPDAEEMKPGERAVFAGILAESGEALRAYEVAEKISRDLLLKEEIVFLNKAL